MLTRWEVALTRWVCETGGSSTPESNGGISGSATRTCLGRDRYCLSSALTQVVLVRSTSLLHKGQLSLWTFCCCSWLGCGRLGLIRRGRTVAESSVEGCAEYFGFVCTVDFFEKGIECLGNFQA